MNGNSKQPTIITGIISLTIVTLSVIFSYVWFLSNDRKLMANNIDNAIAKGIDPMMVRCAYAPSTDNICVAYAVSPHQTQQAPVIIHKK